MLCHAIVVLVLLSMIEASPLDKRATSTVKLGAGIAWPGQAPASLAVPLTQGSLSWSWNWGEGSNGLAAPNFAGMIWGSITSTPTISTEMVMGFNEPDGCGGGQSCVSVGDAISQFGTYIAPLKSAGSTIGAPAVSCAGTWLGDFLTGCKASAACNAAYPAYIPLHVYQNTFESFQDYILSVHDAHPELSIWVTEFAMHNFDNVGNPTAVQQVNDFMGQTTLWMDQQDWIKRYSWFGAGRAEDMGGVSSLNRLQRDDGSLTDLGYQYVYKRHL